MVDGLISEDMDEGKVRGERKSEEGAAPRRRGIYRADAPYARSLFGTCLPSSKYLLFLFICHDVSE